jgi:hypothetical protein
MNIRLCKIYLGSKKRELRRLQAQQERNEGGQKKCARRKEAIDRLQNEVEMGQQTLEQMESYMRIEVATLLVICVFGNSLFVPMSAINYFGEGIPPYPLPKLNVLPL